MSVSRRSPPTDTASSEEQSARRESTLDQPRERLIAQGAAALSDAEVLALLFRTGSRGRDGLALAREVLAVSGGLAALDRAAGLEFRRFPGIGPAKSASLQAAFELGRRVAGRSLRPGAPVRGPADVAAHFRPHLRRELQESFFVVLLDGRHRMISEHLISRGTLTASLVHPREVFRPALREAAAAVILLHNHPSGDPSPSQEDREVTLRLSRAGELMGIPVLDHVVVAESGYCSFRDRGLLTKESGGEVPAAYRP